eukprot:COSAG03_NODE_24895_length_269_cov_0.611765_1_plen_24_part_10
MKGGTVDRGCSQKAQQQQHHHGQA